MNVTEEAQGVRSCYSTLWMTGSDFYPCDRKGRHRRHRWAFEGITVEWGDDTPGAVHEDEPE